MAEIRIKNGEAKTITFTITRAGVPVDLTTADLDFGVKADYEDTSFLISKATADFDKTQAASGIASCNVTTTESDEDNITNGTYKSELRCTFTAGTDVDISANIDFVVEQSLYG